MALEKIVSKEDVKKYFRLDNLDSWFVTDATYWRSGKKLGYCFKFNNDYYGTFVIIEDSTTPENYHEHYKVLEQNAKEIIDKLNKKHETI